MREMTKEVMEMTKRILMMMMMTWRRRITSI
jgi:hypothetical protein